MIDRVNIPIYSKGKYVMKRNVLIKFVALICLAAFAFSAFSICFAEERAASEAEEGFTKEERLINTIYLQDLNYAAAVNGVLAVIDPENKAIMPYMNGEKLYVPIRFVFESVGLEVSWNQPEKCVSVFLDGIEYRLYTKTSTFALGGFEKVLDNECVIKNGTTYVALEDVTNIITCKTHFYPEYKSAVIAFSNEDWIPEREAEQQAFSAMEFAISPFFKMFT